MARKLSCKVEESGDGKYRSGSEAHLRNTSCVVVSLSSKVMVYTVMSSLLKFVQTLLSLSFRTAVAPVKDWVPSLFSDR